MDYNINNGRYYKVVHRQNNEVISFGELMEGQVLSTIHIVHFIDKEEYDQLNQTDQITEE